MVDLSLVLQLFVLLNPLSSFPVLLAAHKQKMDVRKVAVGATLVGFVVAVLVVFAGPALFQLFGISLDSFKIAGGVVLFLLGLDTVRAKTTKKKEIGQVDSLISIIATPLLTGPAVISFITIASYSLGQMALVFNLFVTFAAVGIVFFLFSLSVTRINVEVIEISSKVLGLFLTAVAIQMIATGFAGVFHIDGVG